METTVTGQPGRSSLPQDHNVDKTCRAGGCDNSLVARGYCMKHYLRLRRYGDIHAVKVWRGPYVGYVIEHAD